MSNIFSSTTFCLQVNFCLDKLCTFKVSSNFWSFLLKPIAAMLFQTVNTYNVEVHGITTCISMTNKGFVKVDPRTDAFAESQKDKINKNKGLGQQHIC